MNDGIGMVRVRLYGRKLTCIHIANDLRFFLFGRHMHTFLLRSFLIFNLLIISLPNCRIVTFFLHAISNDIIDIGIWTLRQISFCTSISTDIWFLITILFLWYRCFTCLLTSPPSSASSASDIGGLTFSRYMVFDLLINLLSDSTVRINWQLCIIKIHFDRIVDRDVALAINLFLECILQPLRCIALMGRRANYLFRIFALVPDVLLHFIEYFHFLLCTLGIEHLFGPLQ